MKTVLFYCILSITLFSNSSYAQEFNTFWTSFNKQIKNKDYLIKKIDFPYAYSCNYLGDGEISKAMFQEQGTEVIMNGNAFISKSFFTLQISKTKYKNGYINAYLKDFFIKKFSNLDNLYVICEKGKEEVSSGDKAYFQKSGTEFYFVGFESQQEQGD
jgi:hypothetical protein